MTIRRPFVAAVLVAAGVAASAATQNLANPDTRIIPGHGLSIVGKDTLVAFRDMVVDLRDRVRAMIVNGNTLDEVISARLTANYDATWDRDPTWKADDFLPIVYFELGGSAAARAR